MNINEVNNSAHNICTKNDLFQGYTLEILMTICFILGFLLHKYYLKQSGNKDKDNNALLNDRIKEIKELNFNDDKIASLDDDLLNF